MRVTLKLESLDGRILPGGGWGTVGGGDFIQPGYVPGSDLLHGDERPGTKVGGGSDVYLMGSKPTGAIGDRLPGDTDTGIELLSNDATGGHGGNAEVDLFGGRIITGDV
jgi:hypothetical protein